MLGSVIFAIIITTLIFFVGVSAVLLKNAYDIGGDDAYIKGGVVRFSCDGRSAYKKSWVERIIDGLEIIRQF